ncbi:hypothetical protein GCM10010448_25320 [Streptomyces glomeratus]|uniref:Uncharacterized protein n=1 Tax=Streptomyces glomeratus TaxID=284452 RepID=A0ABP6LID4_9ACTN
MWDLYRCIVVHPVFAGRVFPGSLAPAPPGGQRPGPTKGTGRPDIASPSLGATLREDVREGPVTFGGTLRSALPAAGRWALVSPARRAGASWPP